MFKWVKKEEEYVPKLNDIVYVSGKPKLYLITWVSCFGKQVEVMDEAGNVIILEVAHILKSQTSVGFLSGAQQDKYYGRSPEEILERKINERLEPLVSVTELQYYKKVATIRDLIIKDLNKEKP